MAKGLKGVFIILAFLAMGEAVSWLIGRFVPGNVIGMVLLFIALQVKLVNEESVAAVSEFLTRNMAIMFLPAGVGIMVAYKLLKDNWLPIALATIVSTLLVLAVVGKMQDKLGKKQ